MTQHSPSRNFTVPLDICEYDMTRVDLRFTKCVCLFIHASKFKVGFQRGHTSGKLDLFTSNFVNFPVDPPLQIFLPNKVHPTRYFFFGRGSPHCPSPPSQGLLPTSPRGGYEVSFWGSNLQSKIRAKNKKKPMGTHSPRVQTLTKTSTLDPKKHILSQIRPIHS